METITIKKSEYDRLKIENETLKKELENTKEPIEFLGKKASEWLVLRDLINEIVSFYEGNKFCFKDYFKDLSFDNIKGIMKDIRMQKEAYDKMNNVLANIDIILENLKKELTENA